MEARTVTLTPKPGHLDDVVAFWDDEVVTEIPDQTGKRGFTLLKGAVNGRVVLLSLWESAADADATGSTFRRHTASVSDHLTGAPSPVIVEVAVLSEGVLSL